MGWLDELKARQSHLKELRRDPFQILKKEYLAVEPLMKNLLYEIERELGFDCNKGQASFEWKIGNINSLAAFEEIANQEHGEDEEGVEPCYYYEYACYEWGIEKKSIQLIVDKEGLPHLYVPLKDRTIDVVDEEIKNLLKSILEDILVSEHTRTLSDICLSSDEKTAKEREKEKAIQDIVQNIVNDLLLPL